MECRMVLVMLVAVVLEHLTSAIADECFVDPKIELLSIHFIIVAIAQNQFNTIH